MLTGLLVAAGVSAEMPTATAEATFVVHCYDVGADALEGKPGVIAVERGWSGPREVDRVVYAPRDVTIKQLEAWLQAADTYGGTLEPPMNSMTEKETSR
jgi:hypothetical protein